MRREKVVEKKYTASVCKKKEKKLRAGEQETKWMGEWVKNVFNVNITISGAQSTVKHPPELKDIELHISTMPLSQPDLLP